MFEKKPHYVWFRCDIIRYTGMQRDLIVLSQFTIGLKCWGMPEKLVSTFDTSWCEDFKKSAGN